MTAQEAREISEVNLEIELKRELSDVMSSISSAAKNGLFYVSFVKLSNRTKSKLEELGYSVDYNQVGMCEYEYQVSWS